MNEVEYQTFVFPIEGIHDSISSDQSYFQSDVSYYDHAISYFHSEQGVESLSDFYMHYEDDDSSFVLPNEVIESVDMLGETNKDESFSLPQEDVNKNKVYERGKNILKLFGGSGPSLVYSRSRFLAFNKVVREKVFAISGMVCFSQRSKSLQCPQGTCSPRQSHCWD